jgi:hypothetical protein
MRLTRSARLRLDGSETRASRSRASSSAASRSLSNFSWAALYISARPTRNSVDAWRRIGAVLATAPDRDLLALEPDDIHLILVI